nr:MAG: ORF2 [Giant panda anellovirus]
MGKPEDIWIETIRLSHCLFCSCPNWKEHLQRIWSASTEGTGEEDDPIPDEVIVDFDLGFADATGEDIPG